MGRTMKIIKNRKENLSEDWGEVKPIISIVMVVASLMVLVMLKIEERRMGYEMLKLSRQQRILVEEKRIKTIKIAKLLKPQQIEKMAHSRLTMKRIEQNQIIHLNDNFSNREVN
jgi:hypothetical protein